MMPEPDLFDKLQEIKDRVERVGKQAAGRLLDGRTWDQMPGATTPAQRAKEPVANIDAAHSAAANLEAV